MTGILQDMVSAFIMSRHIIKWSAKISLEVQSFIAEMSHGWSMRAYVNESTKETGRG